MQADVLRGLADSDVLIMSRSSFSYLPALFARGRVVYPPGFWHQWLPFMEPPDGADGRGDELAQCHRDERWCKAKVRFAALTRLVLPTKEGGKARTRVEIAGHPQNTEAKRVRCLTEAETVAETEVRAELQRKLDAADATARGGGEPP